MAIKEKQADKIPSPSDIANMSTDSKSSTTLKFTKEELEKISGLQLGMTQITTAFGQLKMSEIQLEKQTKYLDSELKKLKEEEQKIAKELSSKYGRGSLNIETGEFTPAD